MQIEGTDVCRRMAGDRGCVTVLPTPCPRNPGEVKDALLVRPDAALAGERNVGGTGLTTCGATKLAPGATRHGCAVMWLAAPFCEGAAGKVCHALPGELNTASHVEDDAGRT